MCPSQSGLKEATKLSRHRETQVPALPLAEAALGIKWVLLLSSQGRINPASTTSAECARHDGSGLYRGCFNRQAARRLPSCACASHTCQSQVPKPAPSLRLPHPCSEVTNLKKMKQPGNMEDAALFCCRGGGTRDSSFPDGLTENTHILRARC